MSWTQPICDDCWARIGGRRPYRLVDPDVERCAWCGESTTSGIYLREDPATLPFASED